jgi:hypothetical protein
MRIDTNFSKDPESGAEIYKILKSTSVNLEKAKFNNEIIQFLQEFKNQYASTPYFNFL